MDIFDLQAKLGLNTEEFESGLTSASESANSFASSGVQGAVSALMGVASAAVEAGSEMFNFVDSIASVGDTIDKQSQKLGISAEAYQEWDFILQHSGTSISALQTSMRTLTNAVDSGSDAFQKLGLSQEQVASMSQEDLFSAVITGLQGMEEGSERAALAQDLLGRSATELGPLLNTSAEDTEAMRQSVHDLGGVMSDEAVKDSAAFKDSLQDLGVAFDGIKNKIGVEFLPSISNVMQGLTAMLAGDTGGINQVVDGVGQVFDKIGELAMNFATNVLPALLGEFTPKILTGLVEITMNLVESIPGMVASLFDALQESISSSLPLMMSSGEETLSGFLDGLSEGLTLMLDKGVEFINFLVDGIIENIPAIISGASEVVTGFIETAVSLLPTIMQAGADLVLNLVNGIVNNLPAIIDSGMQMMINLINTIVSNLPSIISQGIQIIGSLVAGLIQAIPTLVGAIPQIIQSAVSVFTSFNWISIGTNIISGIVSGIVSAGGAIVNALLDIAGNAWNSVLGFFGIASPSKLFRDTVGKNLMLGMAEGVDENDPTKDIVGTVSGVYDGVKDAIAGNSFDIPLSVTGANSVNGMDSIMERNFQRLLDVCAEYFPLFAQTKIVLDSGTMVGEMLPAIDEQMGELLMLNGGRL